MDNKSTKQARIIFLYLAALFVTSLVVSNLIFQKFIYWYPFNIDIFGSKLFELSVGILPYPITFLITDLISEIYGQKKANQVVIAGIFSSIFSFSGFPFTHKRLRWNLWISSSSFQRVFDNQNWV